MQKVHSSIKSEGATVSKCIVKRGQKSFDLLHEPNILVHWPAIPSLGCVVRGCRVTVMFGVLGRSLQRPSMALNSICGCMSCYAYQAGCWLHAGSCSSRCGLVHPQQPQPGNCGCLATNVLEYGCTPTRRAFVTYERLCWLCRIFRLPPPKLAGFQVDG
jgi:hypothetical protein